MSVNFSVIILLSVQRFIRFFPISISCNLCGLFILITILCFSKLKVNMANKKQNKWTESQLRKYDFPTDQIPRLSCTDKSASELIRLSVRFR